MKLLKRVLLFGLLVFAMQHLFIAAVPKLIFAIAKMRKPVPVNTVYHAGKTNSSMRKVVLPNPDFIYSACFYDVSNKDLVITGAFPDSTKYCSLAFYGDDVQPWYVRNSMQGFKKQYSIRLSSVNRVQRTLRSKTKQGVVLMRILLTDTLQLEQAKRLQQLFKVNSVPQND